MRSPISVHVDIPNLQQLQADLAATPRQVNNATRRAINTTLRTGSARVSRDIRRKVPIKAKRIKAGLKIIRATRNSLRGIIEVRGRGIPLIEFAARQTKRGVTFALRRGQRVLLRSAYIRDTTKLGRQVLRRKSDPSRRSGLVGRLPTYLRYGPSLIDLFEQLLPNFELDLGDVLEKNFSREIDFELSRGR